MRNRLIQSLLVLLLVNGVCSLGAQTVEKAGPGAEAVSPEGEPVVNPIWHVLKSWTVAGTKTTEPFTITRGPWRVKFECDEGGKAAIFVNSGEKTIEVISGTAKTSYIYEDEGEYYLKIISPASGSVRVEVQQLGGKAAPPMSQLIASYLDKMGYVYRIDEANGNPQISLTMRGENNQYDLRTFIDDDRKIVYMCINRFLICPSSHPRLARVLQRLMELNWELLIGKYEWDRNDGEVRLSHTFSTENGLGYDAFVACFQLLVMTADHDYPELMRLMWGEERGENPSPPTAKPKAEARPQPEIKPEPISQEEAPEQVVPQPETEQEPDQGEEPRQAEEPQPPQPEAEPEPQSEAEQQ